MRALAFLAVLLTFVVVVVGAYVRLSDAGLACPDWPLCYGEPMPVRIVDDEALIKAWKEMAHRYLAGLLGVCILLTVYLAWGARQSQWLATVIGLLVLFQATLGMWTVTMLLKPAIVTAHLLGGMAILALLIWMALSQYEYKAVDRRAIRAPAALALGVLIIQIALGGWVSANYAGLACPDLPLCQGQAVPKMDFAHAFHVLRELGQSPEGGLVSIEALTAIHWTHRMFALVVLGMVGWAAVRAMKIFPWFGIAIALLLLLQLALGVANVAFNLPLALAAAHNAGAALLLAALVVLNFFAFRGLRP
jgi:cytochrome c oxidase assembly protein subunit 15